MRRLREAALNLSCKYLLKPKRIRTVPCGVREIHCQTCDVSMILNTSNNVMKVQTQGGWVYFRECKRHERIDRYVANEIEFYYTQVRPEYAKDRGHIEHSLRDKKNFKKFINMGMTNDSASGAYLFCIGRGAHHIGLNEMSPEQEECVKDFVQYIWGNLFVYRLNNGLKTGDYQTYNAVRCLATYRMAKLLGLESMIPKTEYVKLCVDNNTVLFGVAMDQAPGSSSERMEKAYRYTIGSPMLQRLLNNLQLLDVLCLEKDHRPGNYNVTVENGKVNGVVAFDNDSPNCFGFGGISFETYLGCSPWVVDNAVNRPYIDADLADRILKLTDQDLFDAVGDLLNLYQRITLKKRVHDIKKILKNTPKNKFIGQESWSDDTMKEELSGAYGTTYLTKFLEGREVPYQPWIKQNENGLSVD